MVDILSLDAIKLATLGATGFLLAFLLTPTLTHILYKHKLWRKEVRTEALGGGELPVFKKFHAKGEIHVPRFGGVLIWITPPVLALIFYGLSQTGIWWFEKLNFLSRGQTWLPLATLVAASGVGFPDDNKTECSQVNLSSCKSDDSEGSEYRGEHSSREAI